MLRKVALCITVVTLLSAGCGTIKPDGAPVRESVTTTAGSASVSAVTPKMDAITYSSAQNTQIMQAARQVGISFPFVPSIGLKGTTFKGAAAAEGQGLVLEYSNMSIVESRKELNPETSGGQVVGQKNIQLANRIPARLYELSGIPGSASGEAANLSLRRNNFNIMVKTSSATGAAETVLTEIADSFYAVAGILDQVNDPANAQTIDFVNGWQTGEDYDSRFMLLEAGSLKRNPKQGVLIVKQQTPDGADLSQKQYLTPSRHGPVRVYSFNSFNLTIRAEDGYEWIFNVFDGFRTK